MSEPRPWWRRPRHVIALAAVFAVAVIAVLGWKPWAVPVPEEVAASTSSGYPSRGSLVDAGPWGPDASQAAAVWRAAADDDSFRAPDPDRRIELLWAGDLDGSSLGASRALLQDDAGGRVATGRLVLLQAYNQTAALVAPVDDAGARVGDFTLVAEDMALPDGAALSPGSGIVLYAHEPGGDALQIAGHDETFPLHDGLAVDAPDGIALREHAVPGQHHGYLGLVLTETGQTVAVEDDTVWTAIDDDGWTAASTRGALRDAYETAAERTSVAGLPLASLWGTVDLVGGRTMSVVAVRADGLGGRDPSWVVTGGAAVSQDTGLGVETVRLGTGVPPGLSDRRDATEGPLVARWLEAGTLDSDESQLVVIGSPSVTEAEVIAADRTLPVPGAGAALPAWDDEGAASVVVVVGRFDDGTPVRPLPTGDGIG